MDKPTNKVNLEHIVLLVYFIGLILLNWYCWPITSFYFKLMAEAGRWPFTLFY